MAIESAGQMISRNLTPGSKKRVTVGVSDMNVSDDPDSFIITYSLGPCIGLIAYDPAVRVAGMLHFQLPTSRGHEPRARENPHMFADTGIPLLLAKVAAMGASRNRLRVSIFGGANMLQDENIFKIGIQNARAAKKILWQQCVKIRNEDLGGKASRTVSIDTETGEIRLRSDGQISLYE